MVLPWKSRTLLQFAVIATALAVAGTVLRVDGMWGILLLGFAIAFARAVTSAAATIDRPL